MQKRRTVRDYKSDPVPFGLIENAIATAEEEKESYENRMSDEWLEALSPLGMDWHKPHLEDASPLIVVFAQA